MAHVQNAPSCDPLKDKSTTASVFLPEILSIGSSATLQVR